MWPCLKVIYCAAARSTFTGDLNRVEEAGVRNMVKAFQDECIRRGDHRRAKGPGSKRRLYTDKSKKEIADFKQPYHQVRFRADGSRLLLAAMQREGLPQLSAALHCDAGVGV